MAAFTGGSLLYGSVGHPDPARPGPHRNPGPPPVRLGQLPGRELPDGAGVYPTHGFGSFCSAAQSEASSSTIGQEKRANPALTKPEREFVADLLAGLDAWPAYYAHMAAANSACPTAPDLSPPERASADQIRKRLASGEWGGRPA